MSEARTNLEQISALIPAEAMIVVSKDHVYTELEGEAVILSLKDGVYYGLNAVGLRIWELVQEPATFTKVVATLLSEYDVDPTECENDVTVILRDLASKGLVEIN